VVTTTSRLRFDCDTTAVRRPFDGNSTVLYGVYAHSTTYVTTVGLPVVGVLNKQIGQLGYVTGISMIFEKQSNGRRIDVES